MESKLKTPKVPTLWVILIVVFVGTIAASYDYIKINQAQRIIIQNQVIQAQRSIDYINCLIHINPAQPIVAQEQKCLKAIPKVKS